MSPASVLGLEYYSARIRRSEVLQSVKALPSLQPELWHSIALDYCASPRA